MKGLDDKLLLETDRVLQSEAFRHSEGLRRLLRYLAEKSAASEADQLKEYTIGVDGLGKPESYDPKHDAAVRIQVGRLRQKLSEYYSEEGKADQLVLEIPKGQFRVIAEARLAETVPSATPRAPKWLYWALAGALLWAAVASWLIARKPAATPRWTQELETLWRPMIEPGGSLVVMIADPLFVQFRGFGSYRSQLLNTWEEVRVSPSIASIRKALKDPPIERASRYTGVSDANASFILSKLLAPQVSNLTLGRSSEFSWPMLANNNVIYVGAERVIVGELKNFPVKFAYSYDHLGIANLIPAAGEPELFADPPSVNAQDASEDGESFALVSRFPGPAGQSEIFTFTSNSAPSRLAAVQWFSTAAGARDVVSRLRGASGALPRHYQMILQVKFKAGIPVETSYVRHRALDATVPIGNGK